MSSDRSGMSTRRGIPSPFPPLAYLLSLIAIKSLAWEILPPSGSLCLVLPPCQPMSVELRQDGKYGDYDRL